MMARIRNIKPEFYTHEELQDMEVEHPEFHPMLVFSALWTQCERSGVFLWSIRKLQLSILPFLKFDLEKSLEYLSKHGFIKKFSQDGKDYGYVRNFTRYQAISKKEKDQELKYPVPTEKDLSETIPEPSRNGSGTVPEQSQDNPGNLPGPEDSDSDIGHRTPNLDSTKTQKRIEILDRDPKNDIERVNKKWLENYLVIFGNQPISPRWDVSTPLVSKALKQAGLEKVLQALETARQDKFCLESGYILKIIMSGNVLSRLINAKPAGTGPPSSLEGKKSLKGLGSWK
jgi:hypothetical protein